VRAREFLDKPYVPLWDLPKHRGQLEIHPE
jgi:hypothetical protein